MITIVERDKWLLSGVLSAVPCFSERAASQLWTGTQSGLENMERRLFQLCEEGLLVRHTIVTQEADSVGVLYHWSPGMPEPEFGELAWGLAKRWETISPKRAVFYTAGEKAARHYGRTVTNPLRSASALAHNIGLGAVFIHYVVHLSTLARAWVSEEVLAAARGYGEKVVDACIVDSTATPALAVEFAGASYAASNGERLREIHADCAARGQGLPYEVWTVEPEGTS